MTKLTKKPIRYGRADERTYGRTDPNYRKASLLKIRYMKYFPFNLLCFLNDIYSLSEREGTMSYLFIKLVPKVV